MVVLDVLVASILIISCASNVGFFGPMGGAGIVPGGFYCCPFASQYS